MAEYRQVEGWEARWGDYSLRFAYDEENHLVLIYDSPEYGTVLFGRVWDNEDGHGPFIKTDWEYFRVSLLRKAVEMVEKFFDVSQKGEE